MCSDFIVKCGSLCIWILTNHDQNAFHIHFWSISSVLRKTIRPSQETTVQCSWNGRYVEVPAVLKIVWNKQCKMQFSENKIKQTHVYIVWSSKFLSVVFHIKQNFRFYYSSFDYFHKANAKAISFYLLKYHSFRDGYPLYPSYPKKHWISCSKHIIQITSTCDNLPTREEQRSPS